MSKQALDFWMEALRCENELFLTRFDDDRVEVLRKQIKYLEVQPMVNLDQDSVSIQLERLKGLQKDLMFIRHGITLQLQLEKLAKDVQWVPSDSPTPIDERIRHLASWTRSREYEQTKRHQRRMDSLRQLWPQADQPRRAQIMRLLGTCSLLRFSRHTSYRAYNGVLQMAMGLLRILRRIH